MVRVKRGRGIIIIRKRGIRHYWLKGIIINIIIIINGLKRRREGRRDKRRGGRRRRGWILLFSFL